MSIPGRLTLALSSLALSSLALCAAPALAEGFGFEHLAALRSVSDVAISPDGSLVAYTLSVPRRPGVDPDGREWTHLYVVDAAGERAPRAYVTGDVRVSDPAFTPDGGLITYLAKRGDDDSTALWAIPVDGGESRRWVRHETSIDAYDISSAGQIAFLAELAEDEATETLESKGYDGEVYEEEWRHDAVWIGELPPLDPPTPTPVPAPGADPEASFTPQRLEVDGSPTDPIWSADGRFLVTSVKPRNLIDDHYMLRKVRVFDAAGQQVGAFDNPGKLGDYALSPDGRYVAMVSAADVNDPKEGRLLVAEVGGKGDDGALRDLLPELECHVDTFLWWDDETIFARLAIGTETTLVQVDLDGATTETLRSDGSDPGAAPLVSEMAHAGCRLALVGERPTHPEEVFRLDLCAAEPAPVRLTDSNPWLEDVELAPQEVVTWTASDGLELEGMLLRPLGAEKKAPLLLMVHGGPEAHDRNGWLTNYSRPGQLAAAEGYAVLYPNYRGSTGRGVAFSKTSQGDAAGKEFQDLVEAVDHLVEVGVADRDRVGITGGSYGGYATAWCSTFYSERFRAGVMFVGISNKVSKAFTTDIPNEDQLVHTLYQPWTRWQYSLERSPLFHAEKSTTALLIAGGTGDTRVHPSESLQLYRALKLHDKSPVRYVRYPDEPHGNRRAAARDEHVRRLMRWMNHFVRDGADGLPPVQLDGLPFMAKDSDESEDAE